MTCQLVVDNQRPCDGQPGRMCPNDCDVDCDFNAATLDRVMNYALQPVAANRFPDLVEPAPLPWYKRPPSFRTAAKWSAGLAVSIWVVKFVIHAFRNA